MDKFTLKAILSAVDNLSPVLKGVQNAAKSTRKYLGDVGTSINGLTSKFGVPLGIVSTIAAGFGVAAIKNAVVSFTELAESLQNGALKAGMSSDQFQRMKYVADQAALPIDVMQASMGKLNKSLGAAAMGKNDSLVGLMAALKIPLKDANGQMRSAADLLPQIAESFKLNEDPVKRAAMGTALFGKAYQEMLPFLSEGRDGIDQSLARFAKLKGTIPEADIQAAKEFGDKLQDLDFVTKGFQATIARELIPVLGPLVEGFVQWAAASKKVVGAQVKQVVQELVASLKSVDWGSFLNGIRSSFDAIKSAVDAVGGLKNALIILAVIMNAQTLLAIGGIVGALFRMGLVAYGALFGVSTAAVGSAASLGLYGLAVNGVGAAFVWMRAQAVAAMLAVRIGGGSALWAAMGTAVTAVGSALLTAGRAALLFGRALMFSPLGIILAIGTAAYLVYQNWDKLKAWFVALPATLAASWTAISGIAGAAWDAAVAVVSGKWTQLTAAVSAGVAFLGALLSQWSPVRGVMAAWDPVLAYFKGLWERVSGFIQPVVAAAGWVAGKLGVPAVVGAVAAAAGPLAQSLPSQPAPSQQAAGLAGGGFNLNQPVAANLNGRLDISFKNAPPGMQVEQAKTSAPRVAVNTNVGYRSLATDTGY